uniref:B30.2/SPRY domain-containing protein n=1 Tax=Oncorhynchus kisutch TaxID=8019 RepID=A0A8C7IA49_ONCKI
GLLLRDSPGASSESGGLDETQNQTVDVTFDPDTAHLWLIVSGDGKQVRYGDGAQKLPDNPERFNAGVCVLGRGKGSFTFYPGNGLWTVGLWDGETYEAHNKKVDVLSLKEKPQKVGVFVDYEKGEVSFYNVEASICHLN